MNKRIKALRKTLHLTQAAFGERIGLKGNTITNYETGSRNASESVIISICREFNVNEDWLRNGTGEMFNPIAANNTLMDKITNEYGLDDFQRKLVFEYLNLTPLQKNAVRAFLDKIYDETEEPSKFANVPTQQLLVERDERDAELAKRGLLSSPEQDAI